MADLKISQLTGASTPLAGTEALPIVQSNTTVKVSVANLTNGRDVSLKEINATVSGTGTALQGYNLTNSATTAIYKLSGATYSYRGVGSNALWIGNTNTNETIISNVGSGKVKLGTDAFSYFEIDSSANATLVSGNLVQGTAAKGVNFTANTPLAGMTSQLLNWYEEGTWTPTATNITGTNTYTGTYTRIGNRVYWEIIINTSSSIGITGASSTLSLPSTAAVDSTCAAANRSTGAGFGTGLVTGSNAWPPTATPGAAQSVVVSGSYKV